MEVELVTMLLKASNNCKISGLMNSYKFPINFISFALKITCRCCIMQQNLVFPKTTVIVEQMTIFEKPSCDVPRVTKNSVLIFYLLKNAWYINWNFIEVTISVHVIRKSYHILATIINTVDILATNWCPASHVNRSV